MATEPEPVHSPESGGLLHRLNFPYLIVAVITGFISLSSQPWWTVRAVASSSILNVQVSPFYAEIDALGVSAAFSNSLVLGTATRILLAGTSVTLAYTAFHPKSAWKKPVFWLALSSLVETFLSFSLLLHSTQTIFSDTFGTVPPLSGSAVMQGRIMGLDFNSYVNPTISSSFGLLFFLGLACVALLGGSEALWFILRSRMELINGDLVKGLGEVYLSPPYLHVWFTSSDEALNPLNQDPENLSDDELALSFERILRRMRPGGVVSVVLPGWASDLGERLSKIVPWTGFQLERSELIYRVPGKPENELVFRKPGNTLVAQPVTDPNPSMPYEDKSAETLPREVEVPPIVEGVAEPAWREPRLSRQEVAMVKSAASIIERGREPVQYRELLNEVYMDLLDKKVNFESARQIETILLGHVGRELALVEEVDEASLKPIKRWWLGEKGLRVRRARTRGFLGRLAGARRGIPKVGNLLKRLRKQETGYRPQGQRDEE